MNHLFKKGDVVNIFQMSAGKGLMFEGKATVVRPVGDGLHEHYMVRFKSDEPKHVRMSCPNYERFIDREGQGDPQDYIKAFNRKIGYAA